MSDRALRSQLIRLASELEPGDPARKGILAVLREGETMGETMAKYQKFADDFAKLSGARLTSLRHSGGMVTAEFNIGSHVRLKPAKLMPWMKRSKLTFMDVGGTTLTLYWSV